MKKFAAILLLAVFPASGLYADTIQFDDTWGPAGVTLVHQSKTGFVMNFSMPSVTFTEKVINGEPMTYVSYPGAILGNNEHAPDLPGMGRFFAVPQGASFSYRIVRSESKLIQDMYIGPAMVLPLDTDDSMPVFEKDPVIYATDAYYPEHPVKLSEPRILRGVDAGIIGITPLQYNPVSHELKVYTNLEVEVTFHGGSGQFGENRLRSRFFDPILQMHLVNYDQLPVIDYGNRNLNTRAHEAEYVIIVPDNPFWKDAARLVKEFRTQQGIKTEIYPLSQVGATTTAIKDWIHDAVKNWSMPPAAILLMGDAAGEGAPEIPVPMWSYTPSDNIYADVYSADDLPDVAITRLPAKSIMELTEMVLKTIQYESNPVMDPDFYARPTIAAGWQSDRWFVICADIVHGFFEKAKGKTPNREYAGHSGAPTYWSTNQNTPMLLQYFGPLGLKYIPTVPSHLTDWGGSATRINADFNAGSFFALHRDHGAPSGWSEPSYTTSDLPALSNDPMLPFVLSINCSSGEFDGSSPCFAEAMTRMHHGAIGVIAASSTSYSFVNDTYVFGMIDSFWHDFDPYYGTTCPGSEAILMPCFANVSGKWYLEASDWPYNPTSKPITYHLFHDHCEGMFCMNSEVPVALTVSHAASMPLGATSFEITADAGSFIGLTVIDPFGSPKIIGTGVGTGAPQSITITDPVNQTAIMTVVVTKPNHLRYTDKVFIPEEGAFTEYGTGLAGSGGYVPKLSGEGMPFYGESFSINVTEGLGGTNGLIYAGLSQANLPFLGGDLLVYPINVTIPILLDGSGAGDGTFSFETELFVSGVSIYLQTLLADGTAPMGASMSNGLEIVFP
jgi:hypothetical protein